MNKRWREVEHLHVGSISALMISYWSCENVISSLVKDVFVLLSKILVQGMRILVSDTVKEILMS
jgi:hypothetical protein